MSRLWKLPNLICNAPIVAFGVNADQINFRNGHVDIPKCMTRTSHRSVNLTLILTVLACAVNAEV
jgi:hypothetical protein